MRTYYYSRHVQGGCFVCYGEDAHWFAPNAQAVAARHHDATGHRTWCEVILSIEYGEKEGKLNESMENKDDKHNTRNN